MVNGLTLWGNGRLVPRGPLREPLSVLRRADIVAIHHADLVLFKLEKDQIFFFCFLFFFLPYICLHVPGFFFFFHIYPAKSQISEQSLEYIESVIRGIKESIPIFLTRMAPSYFFDVRNPVSKEPLEALCNSVVLCVSAIGSAKAFVLGMKKVNGFVFVVFCFLYFILGKYHKHPLCSVIKSSQTSSEFS